MGRCNLSTRQAREDVVVARSTARRHKTTCVRVLIADDHPVVRSGLAAVIAQEDDLCLVAQAEDGARAVALFQQHHPDVVLMDLRMPGMDGVEAIRRITTEFPDARIIALTTYDGDADIRRALAAGAQGYLLKEMLVTDVISAIRGASSGARIVPPAVAVKIAEHAQTKDLTKRELEVLGLVARGLTNKEVAAAIGRTNETVKLHLKRIYAKMRVSDRTQAVTIGLRRGLIHLE
jgi:DNA-binding NarL/FixJ family response regulator